MTDKKKDKTWEALVLVAEIVVLLWIGVGIHAGAIWLGKQLEGPFSGRCEHSYQERLTFPYDCGEGGPPCSVTTTVPICAKWRDDD